MSDHEILEDDHVDSYSTEAKANMRSRSQRRDDLLRLIVKNGATISKDHIMGVFMMRVHVSLSTTLQYLQELKMARLVIEYGEQIMTMDQYSAEMADDSKRLKELSGDE